ncbi:hypothetical protein RhiirA5_420145 [Rhizophagus irregularis]|uniref:Uncharacterized protein n=1 Tax=Rhizophagus irregularis TaxID=588596 RepID=A0A2I1F9M6_9GLOM|nr:hypothetical protein RhiirA5_420145 [Rhizophagus irregularis]PKY31075.1 hypothetical protein RhiirB3_448499 [Rhizophagus irregularis]
MSHAENELSEFKSFFKDSHEACVAYYDCLSINESGLTYLDPVKCKAKNFDSKKVAKEQEKRILSFIEKFNKVKEERGAPFAREELKATLIYSNNLYVAYYFQNENTDSLNTYDIPFRPKPFNYLHGPGPEIPYPDNNPSVGKAIQLIGHKIKLYNDDVEVIAVKITKNGIFLNVEKNVEGELIHHEISYENDIVPL